MRKIQIEGSYGDCEYAKFFKANGFEVVFTPEEADLVCFTGGSDVSPHLYGEAVHPTTYVNEERDKQCVKLYEEAKAMGLPCVGICRGSQFLCVMSGGRLYQDIDGHLGTHAVHTYDGQVFGVTSTHHQEMDPKGHYELLMAAVGGTYRSYMSDGVQATVRPSTPTVESVYWPDLMNLSIQGHPEFGYASQEFKDWTIKTIKTKLLGE